MKLSDFKGLFKRSIAYIEDIENPFGNYYIIKLKTDKGLTWRAGEHGIFKLIEQPVTGKKWRPFSVASIPEEGYMLIGIKLRDTISSYKKALINMKTGDKVRITGPFGWFTLQDEISPIVLIAGGIGVTPIRALLKDVEKENKREVEVIYTSSDFHLFENDIKTIQEKDAKINLYMLNNKEETQQEIQKAASKYGNNAYYYISGSQKVIKSVKRLLKSQSIKSKRMINDPFFGY